VLQYSEDEGRTLMIIGLTGAKGSGKNTVGDHMKSAHSFKQLSFAAPLKESAAAALGVDASVWETWKNEPHTTIEVVRDGRAIHQITARQFLQRYGTEAHRDVFGEDFWREQLLRSIEYVGWDERLVVTDVRFEDEAKALIDVGAYIVRVERPGHGGDDPHPSEAPIAPSLVETAIRNYGTLEELYVAVDAMVERLSP
jgi:hypothetical protein